MLSSTDDVTSDNVPSISPEDTRPEDSTRLRRNIADSGNSASAAPLRNNLRVISTSESSLEPKGKERSKLSLKEEKLPKEKDETQIAADEAPSVLVLYTPTGRAYVALRTLDDNSDPLEKLPDPPAAPLQPDDHDAIEDLSAFFPFFFPHDARAEQLFEEMIYDRRRRVLLLLVPIDLLFIALTHCSECSWIPWVIMLLIDLFGCYTLVREHRLLLLIFVLLQAAFSTPYIALTNENPALLLFHMVVLLLTVQLRFTMPFVVREADEDTEDEENPRER